MYVGYPTVEAIVADKIAPGFADWYLEKMATMRQQTDSLSETDRRDNLWEAIPGDHGAHGTFGDRATASVHSSGSVRIELAGMAAGGLAGLVVGTVIKRKQSDLTIWRTDDASTRSRMKLFSPGSQILLVRGYKGGEEVPLLDMRL